MNPESAIRTIHDSENPFAVALADNWSYDVSLTELTPTQQEVLERWLERDAEYRKRFIGVYDRSTTYPELMEDIVFAATQRLVA